MTEIHIHAGLPKTGTSAVQAFLGANAAPLAAQGVFVPTTGQGPRDDHHAFFHAIAGLPPGGGRAMTRSLVNEIADAGAETVLMSSEFAYLGLRWGLAARGYRRLIRAGHRLVFHLFVRPQTDLAVSLYPEVMRNILIPLDFERCLARGILPEIADFGQIEARLRRLGPVSVRVLPYSKLTRRDGIWWWLLADLGLTLGSAARAAFSEPGAVNTSLGPVGVAALQSALSRLGGQGAIRRIGQRLDLRRTLIEATASLPRETTRFQPLAPAERARIRSKCSAANEAFAARHFGRPWAEIFAPDEADGSHPPLCPADLSAFDAEAANLHAEWTERLHSALTGRLAQIAAGRARRGLTWRRVVGAPFDRLADAALRHRLRHQISN